MKYFILAFILIFNSFAIANDEVTSTEVEDNAPASFAQRCQAIEESFKGFFTNILDSSLSDLTQSTNCLSLSPVSQQDQCLPIRARIVGQLISRRGLLLEVHREVGQQWLNEKLNGPNGYMYRNCFGDRVQFQEHIRVLETTDQLSCQPFVFDWSSSLDRRVMDYLSSPPTTSQLSSNEVDELRQFLSSPIKRMLPNHAVYNQSWTEDQLREALHVV
ncbi:MAG: hypothetical protein HRT44_00745 [Bdellovibrionales bacterium]|nr:hypothetical protein [Bdellovibrionales bacterium]NQZ17778.1 hypothetical protein [Bdellovibrionales bacterium]